MVMIEDWFDIWFFDEAYDLYKGGYTKEHLEEAYYAGWQKSKQVNMAIREIGVLSEFEDVN